MLKDDKMIRKKLNIHLIIAIALVCSIPLLAANTWMPLNTPEEYQSFTKIDNSGKDIVWALSSRDLIKSNDGGENWELIYSFDYGVNDFKFYSDQIGYAVGWPGNFSKTTDGGKTWTTTVISSNVAFQSLAIVSENVFWVVGNNSTVMKTIDGGVTWNSISIPFFINTIYYVKAVNEDYVWLGAGNRMVQTKDGGDTWDGFSLSSSVNSVCFTDTTTGFATMGNIYKSTNGGQTWRENYDINYTGNPKLYNLNENTIWLIGQMAAYWQTPIYRTVDGGDHWENQDTYISDPANSWDVFYLNDMCAFDTSTAWIAGEEHIYKYTTAPTLNLTYPNGGEDLDVGETVQITWTSDVIPEINIFYTTNGSDWIMIDDSVSTLSGSYIWQVPDEPSTECFVKLEPCDSLYLRDTDQSDDAFTISELPISYVDYDLYDRCDFSEMNPFNVFEKQTPIRMKVKVKNNLTQNLLSASGILRSKSDHIVVTDSISSYNNILVNYSEWSSKEFEFQISADAPNEFIAEFELEISDQILSGGPWVSSFIVPVVMDPFEIGLVLVDDDNNPDSQGDNDDIIEPGETAEIIPLINNMTANEYDDVEGELFCSISEIEIWDVVAGASGTVYSHYPYNVISGRQEVVSANQINIMPQQDFVLTYDPVETFNFPLILLISAELPKYSGTEMRWVKTFWMNSGYPQVGVAEGLPEEFLLSHYPNPFNPNAVISYQLPYDERIDLSIYDLRGQKVRTLISGFQDAGYYNVNFNAADLPSGVYLYCLTAGNEVMTKKMVLMK